MDLRKDISGAGIGFSDQDEVGAQHVADHRTQRDEFRIIAQAQAPSDGLSRKRFQCRAHSGLDVPRHHGAGQCNNVITGLFHQGHPQRSQRGQHELKGKTAIGLAWSRHDDERHIGIENRPAKVCRCRQVCPRLLDELLQARFGNRGFPTIHRLDMLRIGIDANDRVAFRCQYRRPGGAQLPQPDDRDIHGMVP